MKSENGLAELDERRRINLRVSESISKVDFDSAEREQIQDRKAGLKRKTENCE